MTLRIEQVKGGIGSSVNFELSTWIKSKRKSRAANRQSFWTWRNWILSI